MTKKRKIQLERKDKGKKGRRGQWDIIKKRGKGRKQRGEGGEKEHRQEGENERSEERNKGKREEIY